MEITRTDTVTSHLADPAYFNGRVWQEPVIEAPEPARVRALRVTVEPGARTAWHTHPLGQTLHVLSGTGRIATRVMQTALAVRQTVIKLLDIMVYVVVYFVSVLVLFAGIDLRLALPMAVWLVFYVAILWVVLPRLQRVAERQADARAPSTPNLTIPPNADCCRAANACWG